MEVNVKRKRLTQIVLVIVGLVNLAIIYFLYMDLRHASWLLVQKNETEPMFLSFFIPAGIFLLLAARTPSEHRSMIALAAWWNISHATVMAIQTVQSHPHPRRPQTLPRRNPLLRNRRRPPGDPPAKAKTPCANRCVKEDSRTTRHQTIERDT